MALPPTIHRLRLSLTDVERGVYEELDLRLARHPSETMRYMLLRTLAYALCYQEGIAFSREGLCNPDEPPVTVRDATGRTLVWVEVGVPSAERLHKASKGAEEVHLFTVAERAQWEREARRQTIFQHHRIAVWRISPQVLAEIEPLIGRDTKVEVTRTEGALYLALQNQTFEMPLEREPLLIDA